MTIEISHFSTSLAFAPIEARVPLKKTADASSTRPPKHDEESLQNECRMPIRKSACVVVVDGAKLYPMTASTPLEAFR